VLSFNRTIWIEKSIKGDEENESITDNSFTILFSVLFVHAAEVM
jgi:hypothetical protein